LLQALKNVDIVSHQAAYQDYMPDFSRFLHVNAVATALLFELVVNERLKVKKMIVASSQSVYGEGQYECAEHQTFLPSPRCTNQLSEGKWEVECPRCGRNGVSLPLREEHNNPYNQYAVSKLAQEKTALGLGWLHEIPTVALRYSITQGPRQSLFNHYSGICRIFVSRAKRGEPLLIYEDGKQTRDFVHVQDVVDANMLVLESDRANFQAFNVGSGQPISVLEYFGAVRDKIGPHVIGHVSGEYRKGDNRHSVSCVEKLQAIGWEPRRNLSTILDDFLEWVEDIGGIPEPLSDAHFDMKQAGVVLSSANLQTSV
jgi:dTDP-L-rhamnose 4-epimerase